MVEELLRMNDILPSDHDVVATNSSKKTLFVKKYFLLHLQAMPEHKHSHIILYAEDDLDDLFMIRQAFEQFDETIELLHAGNGFEALERLGKAKNEKKLPCLVVLDINMPGMNGREALIRIRQSEDLKNIPVVLFTTSSSELDKSFARKWGAEFITKPLIYSELKELAGRFLSLCTASVSQRA